MIVAAVAITVGNEPPSPSAVANDGTAVGASLLYDAGTSTTAAASPANAVGTTIDARAAASCELAPRADCMVAGRSQLRIDDRADAAKDRIDWTWKRGAEYAGAAIGDPSTTTSFALCIYDAADGVGTLAAALSLEPSEAWRATSKGWRYDDGTASVAGIRQLRLDGGSAGKSRVRLRARGAAIPMPAHAGAERFFEAQPDVRVQLVAMPADEQGLCWTSVFSSTSVRRNDASSFRATAGAPAQTPKKVFVSSACYDGALGGLGGADSTCQALADAAALGGTYRAWLADAGDGPATRFAHATVPYVLVDGSMIARDWSDLTDGSLATPIALDESGSALSPASGCANEVWTNTDVDGSPAIGDGYEFVCQNWTISLFARSALTGDASAIDAGWTDGGAFAMRNCNLLARIYCVEQ